MKTGPVILHLMPSSSVAEGLICAEAFIQHGLALTHCASLSDVTAHIWAEQGKHDARIVLIIDGRDQIGRQCVAVLRALHQELGIVALIEPDSEAEIIQLLHSGVDAHCALNASPDLFVAIILRLLWRLGVIPSRAPGVKSDQGPESHSSSWGLIDQGWVFCSPAGHRIPLTTGERAFLMTLFNAPAQKVPHAELIDAVNAAYNTINGQVHRSRLGVMVSRMRRKFRQAGAPLPLKSVHNWGYMLVMNSHSAPGDTVRGQSVCSETEP